MPSVPVFNGVVGRGGDSGNRVSFHTGISLFLRRKDEKKIGVNCDMRTYHSITRPSSLKNAFVLFNPNFDNSTLCSFANANRLSEYFGADFLQLSGIGQNLQASVTSFLEGVVGSGDEGSPLIVAADCSVLGGETSGL